MTNFLAFDRPKHSSMAAFIRSLQMSKRDLFVFVEGNENDPFFYGNLCEAALEGTFIQYTIRNPQSIPGSSSGKTALLALFEYLNRASSLISELNGKKTAVFIFLDKDVDDFLGQQVESEHVKYTYYYDVENHIFKNGTLKRACAAAASVDPQIIEACVADQEEWLKNSATKWKDWVKICLFSRFFPSVRSHNYSRSSPFNSPITGDIDLDRHKEVLSVVQSQSSLSEGDFNREFDHVSQLVDDLYQNGEYGKVFKGKWFRICLASEIRKVVNNEPGNVDGIERHITRHLANTLDFNSAWTDYFKKPLATIIAQLQT
ncbi:MAG: DUF4435 domain-containing protein [Syntrophobacteraceae bacterium]